MAIGVGILLWNFALTIRRVAFQSQCVQLHLNLHKQNGRTPLDIAKAKEHSKIVSMLQAVPPNRQKVIIKHVVASAVGGSIHP